MWGKGEGVWRDSSSVRFTMSGAGPCMVRSKLNKFEHVWRGTLYDEGRDARARSGEEGVESPHDL